MLYIPIIIFFSYVVLVLLEFWRLEHGIHVGYGALKSLELGGERNVAATLAVCLLN